jgi:4-hydroxy-tetrahydrodipicolinate reductase
LSVRVLVSGCGGRMGREVLRAVHSAEGMEVVGGVDTAPAYANNTLADLCGISELKFPVDSDLTEAIARTKPHVLVDFTVPGQGQVNAKMALQAGVRPVVGTTGITEDDLKEIDRLAREKGIGAVVAPNFAIGAVLMMKFAVEAARYMPYVEIIEFHHDGKLDAPSGTAIKTAKMISEAVDLPPRPKTEKTIVEGARGGEIRRSPQHGEVNIHAVRLPGFVAHQEVILGGVAQTLTIRHDSIGRESFMPGVLLAIRKVMELEGLVYGLENLI